MLAVPAVLGVLEAGQPPSLPPAVSECSMSASVLYKSVRALDLTEAYRLRALLLSTVPAHVVLLFE